MKNKKSGFTLIELLVAVLIIGILAALAIPQYRLTVAKIRAAEALVNLRAIIRAQQLYMLQTGDVATNLNMLDIALPSSDNFTYEMSIGGSSGLQLYAHSKSGNLTIYTDRLNKQDTNLACYTPVDDTLGNKVCISLGGVFGTKSNGRNYYYKIQ
jgi:type IV pilus assembly protein PilE